MPPSTKNQAGLSEKVLVGVYVIFRPSSISLIWTAVIPWQQWFSTSLTLICYHNNSRQPPITTS